MLGVVDVGDKNFSHLALHVILAFAYGRKAVGNSGPTERLLDNGTSKGVY